MKLLQKLFMVIAIGWAGFCLFALTQRDLQPVLITLNSPPHLELPAAPVQLGTVTMDTQSTHRLLIRNTGFAPLLIQSVEASCGCTVPELAIRRLLPAEHAWITLKVDASLKLGSIHKTLWIRSNDPKQREAELAVQAEAVAPRRVGMTAHDKITPKDKLALFKGSCKACHVDKGQGQSGQALFIADCGMCHGPDAKGGVAPSLLNANYEEPAVRASLREVIAAGSPNNPSMPPFAQAHGGPLSEQQIDSLMVYLAYAASQQTPAQKDARP